METIHKMKNIDTDLYSDLFSINSIIYQGLEKSKMHNIYYLWNIREFVIFFAKTEIKRRKI